MKRRAARAPSPFGPSSPIFASCRLANPDSPKPRKSRCAPRAARRWAGAARPRSAPPSGSIRSPASTSTWRTSAACRRAAVTATVEALSELIENGRPEFRDKTWVPHRPPRPEKSEGGIPFSIVSDFEPKGDQPTAIAELVAGVDGAGARPGAPRRHRLGQDLHHGQGDRGDAAAGADPRAEQDARRPALWRVQELLPRQRGRVFRLLLRLLPARGLRPAHRHLYREGIARSTSRSTACATRRRARCSSATT